MPLPGAWAETAGPLASTVVLFVGFLVLTVVVWAVFRWLTVREQRSPEQHVGGDAAQPLLGLAERQAGLRLGGHVDAAAPESPEDAGLVVGIGPVQAVSVNSRPDTGTAYRRTDCRVLRGLDTVPFGCIRAR